MRRRNAFCYIDARPGQIVHLCIQKDGLGFQVFKRATMTTRPAFPAQAIASSGTPVTRELGRYEALYSNRKIREVLGFVENHNWRQYVPDPAAGD